MHVVIKNNEENVIDLIDLPIETLAIIVECNDGVANDLLFKKGSIIFKDCGEDIDEDQCGICNLTRKTVFGVNDDIKQDYKVGLVKVRVLKPEEIITLHN